MIVKTIIDTPLGPLEIAATEKGICQVGFAERTVAHGGVEEVTDHYAATIVTGENEHLKQAIRELGEYFAGQRTQFTVALDTPGTPFQREVWTALLDLSYGQTASYGQIAQRIGKPKGSQAVGLANGRNRVAIIVPCHRVVGANGKLTGYAGGIERKKWLLRHESASLF